MGSVQSIKIVKDIIQAEREEKIVVCSAVSGVTDKLIRLADKLKDKQKQEAMELLTEVHAYHKRIIQELIHEEYVREILNAKIELVISGVKKLAGQVINHRRYSQIITSGEILSTTILAEYFNYENIDNTLLYAKDFMHIKDVDNPNLLRVGKLLKSRLKENRDCTTFITQGFICCDKFGELSHLSRGGSDYSATIIGAALYVKEVQIWTDINGLHNNDPRFVENTYTIPHITYTEAAEMAYYGAKVLHPKTTFPLSRLGIPIWLKNTFNRSAQGTLISNTSFFEGLKGVAARDNIHLLKVSSDNTRAIHTFIKDLFEVFDRHHVSIEMVTTSKSIHLIALQDHPRLKQVIYEIESFADVKTEKQQSIISIVGQSLIKFKNTLKFFDIFSHYCIKMLSYGASDTSILLLVDEKDKCKVLQLLNDKLFSDRLEFTHIVSENIIL